MRTSTHRILAPAVTAGCLALAGLLAACASESDQKVAVVGTDDACTPATSSLTAGKVTFEFRNTARQISELYVLRADETVVGEVENVTTGTKRTLTVSLSAGDYVLVCKPGQAGEGFRQEIDVTGAGGDTTRPADRTVTVVATTYSFTAPPDLDVKRGEVIRFEMANAATDMQHEMEVFDPDGNAIGEVGPTDPGKVGVVTIVFEKAGTYRLVCGIEGHEAAGMTATVEVVAA